MKQNSPLEAAKVERLVKIFLTFYGSRMFMILSEICGCHVARTSVTIKVTVFGMRRRVVWYKFTEPAERRKT
jgi:hypothetical protein